MAKERRRIDLSAQAWPAVPFHWSKFQHLVWLCMWSKRQCSGTRRASDWKGPSGGLVVRGCNRVRELMFFVCVCIIIVFGESFFFFNLIPSFKI